MSSVTRLHLLSQSMLNVSGQKQRHCHSLPTDTLTESTMEFVGQTRPTGAYSLLGVPGLSTLNVDVDDDDEGEMVIGIRPKSSPLPRRRTSISDEDSEPEPPPSGSRRVSFADAKGLSLVHVKEFDTWDVPKLPGYDSSESECKDAVDYILSPLTFSLPLPSEELFIKVHEQKVELETIELLPGTTVLKGTIRVLNISFNKSVYVRTTLDTWSSHFDLLAEYIPGSSDSLTDCFSFKLTLVPPFGEQGARVDFCLRYETPVGTFWANNNNKNYALFCHQRMKNGKEKPEKENVHKKSCLKTIGPYLSTVEKPSAISDSSQENTSTDLSNNEEKVDAMKTKKMLDGQSRTSEENAQKLLAESRRNCSRRNRRKAARMARVRDFFALQGGAATDKERDESPPEEKQASQEGTQGGKHADAQSVSVRNSKSEACLFDSESLEKCSEHVLDAAKAHDDRSNSEPVKSDSINVDDSAILTGVWRATDNIQDNPFIHSNDDPASAECQNSNRSVSIAEDSSQKKDMGYECTSNIAAEPADSVTSAMSRESLVNKTSSCTFGTVVAPLYHDAFGRVGGGSQSAGDWGHPVRDTLNVGDLIQNYPHTDRRETSRIVPKDARGNIAKIQGTVIKTQELKELSVHTTLDSLPIKEEETGLGMTANDALDRTETLQDPVILSDQRRTNTSDAPNHISGDTVVRPHTVEILSTDSLDPQIHTVSPHLRGEAMEDNNLQSQTTAETALAQPPGHTCPETKTNLDQSEEVIRSFGTSFMSLQPSQKVLEQFSDDIERQTSGSGTSDCKCVLQISLDTYEETNDVEEENEEPVMSNCPTHTDTFIELKDANVLQYEEIIVSETIEHHEMEVAGSKQEDFCLADSAELKNWEMMVEEEEKNILTHEERGEAMTSKAEEDKLEDAGIETPSETENTTEEKEYEAEDGDVKHQDKQRLREEPTGETVAGKNTEETGKELENVEAAKTEKTAREEEPADDTGTEKKEERGETELEKEKHLVEMQEVSIDRIKVQDKEEIEGEEEVELDMNDDTEAGVEWEDQVESREEIIEEENPDYKEEILVDETSMIAEAEPASVTVVYRENEVGCFEERLDITQNKVEDGLFASVNNVQDKRVIDSENTGEEQNAHISNEMHLYKEGTSHSNKNDAHDPSKAAGDESESAAAEGGPYGFADEPEYDQLSHDSTSAESDSDDEVELYMHCLRAVHVGEQANKDRNKDTTGLKAGKSAGFSGSRSKLLSTPMPSISESLDEEQPQSCHQDSHEDTETADITPIAATLPDSSGQESINRNASWWTETFSCSNISKTLLNATLFLLFAVVAYHYDFLACFGLYVISVIWLCCQGEKQPVKNNNKLG